MGRGGGFKGNTLLKFLVKNIEIAEFDDLMTEILDASKCGAINGLVFG